MGFCEKCHSKITDDDSFCPNCGASTKLNEIKTSEPNPNYSIKELVKKFLISYYIVFMIDIIGLGVLFELFNNGYSTNPYNAMNYGQLILFVLVIIIGTLEPIVFITQFKFDDNIKSNTIKKIYLIIPTIHVLILIGVAIFIYSFSSNIYFNFLSYLIISMILGQLIVGFYSLYHRVILYYKSQPLPELVDLPPNYHKFVQDKKKKTIQAQQEEVFDRQQQQRNLF